MTSRDYDANTTEQGIWSIDDFPVSPVEGKTRFHDFDLPAELMHAIADLGFEYCSPIQAEILPHTLQGVDAIGKAQTGTGKTAAFLITVITNMLENPGDDERYLGEPKAVVLAPTRELAMQIAEDAALLTKHCDLNVALLIGGTDYDRQLKTLHNNVVDILVGTPGRLMDFVERNEVQLHLVETMIIDEADRMLDMGFIPQVRRIVKQTPPRTHRQTLMFSATFTPTILDLIERWTDKPVTIEIEPDRVATDSVDQRIYLVSEDKKFRVLTNLLRTEAVELAIVFANRRDQVRRLHEQLAKRGIDCGILSGEVAQQKRTRTLQRFKDGDCKIIVATDVAGRGIHVDGISHVINFNLPEDPEDYVHRIGRTGRAGAKGTSISLACESDSFMLLDIEELLGYKLNYEQAPAELLEKTN
ncbi:MAG: ATP-dependent RNA helicase RhlB [Pseudomonadales bacterium]